MTDADAAELCRRLTGAVNQALIDAYGDTDCHCEQASVALAFLLRRRGVDARVLAAAAAGSARHVGRPEFYIDHCWVTVDPLGLLCDPTVDQFRPGAPLVCPTADAAGYDPGNPANWHQPPPDRPDRIEQVHACAAWGRREMGWTGENTAAFHAAVAVLAG